MWPVHRGSSVSEATRQGKPSLDCLISGLHSLPADFRAGDHCREKLSAMKAIVGHSLVVQDLEFAGLLAPEGKGPFLHRLVI